MSVPGNGSDGEGRSSDEARAGREERGLRRMLEITQGDKISDRSTKEANINIPGLQRRMWRPFEPGKSGPISTSHRGHLPRAEHTPSDDLTGAASPEREDASLLNAIAGDERGQPSIFAITVESKFFSTANEIQTIRQNSGHG